MLDNCKPLRGAQTTAGDATRRGKPSKARGACLPDAVLVANDMDRRDVQFLTLPEDLSCKSVVLQPSLVVKAAEEDCKTQQGSILELHTTL